MYCWAPDRHSVSGVVQQLFPFLSPLAGFLLIQCSFLLGFIAAGVLCSSMFCLLSTSVEVQAVLPVVLQSVLVPRIFLAKVQVFALVEFMRFLPVNSSVSPVGTAFTYTSHFSQNLVSSSKLIRIPSVFTFGY